MEGRQLNFQFCPFSSFHILVAEFAEYEMICKALRTEHQELQEDMISLKQVVHQLEHLHKEYQVCVRACVCAKECRGTNMRHYRHEHRHTPSATHVESALTLTPPTPNPQCLVEFGH